MPDGPVAPDRDSGAGTGWRDGPHDLDGVGVSCCWKGLWAAVALVELGWRSAWSRVMGLHARRGKGNERRDAFALEMADAGDSDDGGIGNWTAAAGGGDRVGAGRQYAAVVEGGVIPGGVPGLRAAPLRSGALPCQQTDHRRPVSNAVRGGAGADGEAMELASFIPVAFLSYSGRFPVRVM